MLASLFFIAFVSTSSTINFKDKIMLFTWLDTHDSFPGSNDGDRPRNFTKRMELNVTGFHYAQEFPIPVNSYPFPYEQVQSMGPDAAVLLTVYPKNDTFFETDIDALVTQCKTMNKEGRMVVVRFGPEMNGYWMKYGMRPSFFVPLWRRIYTAIKSGATETKMLWSPNHAEGYPFGYSKDQLNAEDFALINTNKNGQLDSEDDAFSPFYPGDEFVDLVGLSIYHFGGDPPFKENKIPIVGDFEKRLNAQNFYNTYSKLKNLPFSISESAAAFHPLNPDFGPGELVIKQAWWRQTITNASFFQAYPLIKIVSLFEFKKVEHDGEISNDLRDFRVSTDSIIRNQFLKDFFPVLDLFLNGNLTLTNPTILAVNPPTQIGSASIMTSFYFVFALVFQLFQ